MMFKRTAAGKDDTPLKMTAMIDVVFQLLIFFLVGTQFRTPEGEMAAHLPKEGPGPVDKTAVDPILVTLLAPADRTHEPAVRVDGRPISMGRLENRMFRIASDKRIRDSVPVIIEAEPDVRYRWVIRTLNVSRKAGFGKVHFAASKRNATRPDVTVE
jgi:biopolymer transport protein ExbD